ncbi:unnamed protein product [Amoebophrya sp. A120]|nr:unnamed protein product [Amoebophrya sp. A120]|eukprot:GSA120T00013793001.1
MKTSAVTIRSQEADPESKPTSSTYSGIGVEYLQFDLARHPFVDLFAKLLPKRTNDRRRSGDAENYKLDNESSTSVNNSLEYLHLRVDDFRPENRDENARQTVPPFLERALQILPQKVVDHEQATQRTRSVDLQQPLQPHAKEVFDVDEPATPSPTNSSTTTPSSTTTSTPAASTTATNSNLPTSTTKKRQKQANKKAKNTLLKQWNRDENWINFLAAYDHFVKEFVIPDLQDKFGRQHRADLYASSEKTTRQILGVFYQEQPVLRIVFPNSQVPPSRPHKDLEYGHFEQEINYWLPICQNELNGRNTLWVESEPGLGDYKPFVTDKSSRQRRKNKNCDAVSNASQGTVIRFDGMHLHHYAHLDMKNDEEREEVPDHRVCDPDRVEESELEPLPAISRTTTASTIATVKDEISDSNVVGRDISSSPLELPATSVLTTKTGPASIREEKLTRISFDFRVLPVFKTSITTPKTSAPEDEEIEMHRTSSPLSRLNESEKLYIQKQATDFKHLVDLNTDIFHNFSTSSSEKFNTALEMLLSSATANPMRKRFRLAENQHGLFKFVYA